MITFSSIEDVKKIIPSLKITKKPRDYYIILSHKDFEKIASQTYVDIEYVDSFAGNIKWRYYKLINIGDQIIKLISVGWHCLIHEVECAGVFLSLCPEIELLSQNNIIELLKYIDKLLANYHVYNIETYKLALEKRYHDNGF